MSYPQARGVSLSKLETVMPSDKFFKAVSLCDAFKNKASSSKTLLFQCYLTLYDTMTLFLNKVF